MAAIVTLLGGISNAQVSVAMAPPIHFQFFNANGAPLANGKLYTYNAGTTTCVNTYVDSSGTTQNLCPIPLDATGSPANNSGAQTGIFLANQAYKFCGYDSNSALQWCVDNVTSYFNLLNSANTWTATQTFTAAPTITLADNQIIVGLAGVQTTLDFPPPAANITLHFPTTADTMVGRATTDTLSNKTLSSPLFNSSGCAVTGGPGTYICPANASPTGTTANTLSILINAPAQATIAPLSTVNTITTTIVGICVSSCGNTGNAVIQQSGQAACAFDAATTAGDWVGPNNVIAGDCHDLGIPSTVKPPPNAVGIVLSTNASSGTFQVLLAPNLLTGVVTTSVLGPPPTTGTTSGTSPVAAAGYQFAAGALNALSKGFRLTSDLQISPAGSYTTGIYFQLGSTFVPLYNVAATTASYWTSLTITCDVTAPGVSGQMRCVPQITTFAPVAVTPAFTNNAITVNLTTGVVVAGAVSFGTANAANAFAVNTQIVETIN